MLRKFYHAEGDAQDVRNLRIQVWLDRPSGAVQMTPVLSVEHGEDIATRLSEALDMGIGKSESFCPACHNWRTGVPRFLGANRPRCMCERCERLANACRGERERRHVKTLESDPLRGIRTIHLSWSSWYKRVREWKVTRAR